VTKVEPDFRVPGSATLPGFSIVFEMTICFLYFVRRVDKRSSWYLEVKWEESYETRALVKSVKSFWNVLARMENLERKIHSKFPMHGIIT
jgi:hypothetical protein